MSTPCWHEDPSDSLPREAEEDKADRGEEGADESGPLAPPPPQWLEANVPEEDEKDCQDVRGGGKVVEGEGDDRGGGTEARLLRFCSIPPAIPATPPASSIMREAKIVLSEPPTGARPTTPTGDTISGGLWITSAEACRLAVTSDVALFP